MKISVTDFSCSYWSQCFQIVCTPSGRQCVLCKWKLRRLSSFCFLFSFFFSFFPSATLISYIWIFSVKDFSATTLVRILKFGTKLDSDELYCVTKNSYKLLINPLICSFFFLSNGNFCHRFLSSYWSQCFHFVYTFRKAKCIVFMKFKMLILMLPFFTFHFFLLPLLLSYIWTFFVKYISGTTWVRILKFGTKLDSDNLYCVTNNSHILLISLFICWFFSFSPMKISVPDFSCSYWSQSFNILCIPSGRQIILWKWKLRC